MTKEFSTSDNSEEPDMDGPVDGLERITPPAAKGKANTPKLSLKDYYLSEYDDDSDAPGKKKDRGSPGLSSQIAKSWRAFLTLFAAFIGTSAVIASLFYLWISDQSGEEELRASRGVADVAMALTYAHLKNIQPQNQNWTYPDFIKNNLSAIIAPKYNHYADFDAHGQFSNCPYLLRIYTSSDLSYFLVIAQPSPSLLQWLLPKASIVIDSRGMEMRKIIDLKALNRLIVNANNLDGINANEIFNTIRQGELIPLSNLGSKKDNQGFIPPKALGLIRPGAENLIYNAPRYYVLGETVLNTSLHLVEKSADSRDVGLLQNELNTLLKFPNLVLYSSEGIQHALLAQHALTTIAPQDKFLIAYVQMNNNGKITSSHLLMDDTPNDIGFDSRETTFFAERENKANPDEGATAAVEMVKDQQKDPAPVDSKAALQDQNDPLLLQLIALASARQAALKPIAEELIEQVRKETLSTQTGFQQQFDDTKKQFEQTDVEQQGKIFAKFDELLKENTQLSASKFVELIQQANLSPIFRSYLHQISLRQSENAVSEDEIESQLKMIGQSASWNELEERITQVNKWLQFSNVPNEIRLIALQNKARLNTTQKLSEFILDSKASNDAIDFDDARLVTLFNILNAAWITDPDTHDFYIAEFEQRKQSKSS